MAIHGSVLTGYRVMQAGQRVPAEQRPWGATAQGGVRLSCVPR